MHETNKVNTILDVKLNKSSSLYHCIRSFINLRQGENEPNNSFKLSWDYFYETMELSGGENILISNQLVKVAGYQSSSKEKQVKVDDIKKMGFPSKRRPK